MHLADWPSAAELPADDELVEAMDEVRDVCSATLSVRKAHGRRVRQPLATLTVAVPDAARLAPFADIIADEVNVRDVQLTDDVGAVAGQVLQVVPATIGPRLGKHTQDVIRAVKAGEWTLRGRARRRRRALAGAGRVHADDGRRRRRARARRSAAARGVIVLDVDVTPELEQEGRARDLIRLVQQARRDADLAVTDRIALTLTADDAWIDAARAHEDLIAGETLGQLTFDAGAPTDVAVTRRQPRRRTSVWHACWSRRSGSVSPGAAGTHAARAQRLTGPVATGSALSKSRDDRRCRVVAQWVRAASAASEPLAQWVPAAPTL